MAEEDGRLEVEVGADASKFGAELEQKVNEASKGIRARIKVAVEDAQSTLKAEIEDAAKQASKGVTASIRLAAAGIREFQAEVEAAAKEAGKTSITIKVEADTKTLAAQVRAAKEAAQREAGSIKLDVDVDKSKSAAATSSIQNGVAKVKEKLDSATQSALKFESGLLKAAGVVTPLAAIASLVDGIASSVAGLGGALGGIAGGLYALTAAALPAAKALAVIPGLVGGIVAAAGTGVAGFHGIGAALQALTQADTASAATAKQSGQTRAQAAKKVADAHQAIADAQYAELQSSRSLRDAQENLASAYQQAEDDGVAAADKVKAAQANLAATQTSATKAQAALAKARRDEVTSLEDLRLQLKDAALSEEGAELAVERAKKNLDETNAKDSASSLDKREADLAYRQALQQLEDQKQSNKELGDTATDAFNKGVDGADSVVSAQEAAKQATDAVTTATQDLATAQADQQKQAVDSAKSIRDATESLETAQHSLEGAQRAVTNAQSAYQDALHGSSDATGAAATATSALQAAMDKLSPAGQNFVHFLHDTFLPSLGELSKSAQQAMLPGVQAGLESLLKLKGPVKEALGTIGGALGDMASRAGASLGGGGDQLTELVGSTGTKDFKKPGEDKNTPFGDGTGFAATTEKMGQAAGNLGVALKNLMLAADPLVQRFNDWVVSLTAGWAAEGSTETGLKSMRDSFQKVGDKVSYFTTLIGTLWQGLKNLSGESDGAGKSLSGSLLTSAQNFVTFTETHKDGITKFFNDSAEILKMVGSIFVAIAGELAKLATDPNTQKFIAAIKDDLGPALGKLLDALNKSGVGEKFISAIGRIADIVTGLVKKGAFTGFLTFIDDLIDAFTTINGGKAGGGWLTTLAADIAKVVGFAAPIVALTLGLNKLKNGVGKLFGLKPTSLFGGIGKLASGLFGKITGKGKNDDGTTSRDESGKATKSRMEVFWTKSMPVYLTERGASNPDEQGSNGDDDGDGKKKGKKGKKGSSAEGDSTVVEEDSKKSSSRTRAEARAAESASGSSGERVRVVDSTGSVVEGAPVERNRSGGTVRERAAARSAASEAGSAGEQVLVADAAGEIASGGAVGSAERLAERETKQKLSSRLKGSLGGKLGRFTGLLSRSAGPVLAEGAAGGLSDLSGLLDQSLAPTVSTAEETLSGGASDASRYGAFGDPAPAPKDTLRSRIKNRLGNARAATNAEEGARLRSGIVQSNSGLDATNTRTARVARNFVRGAGSDITGRSSSLRAASRVATAGEEVAKVAKGGKLLSGLGKVAKVGLKGGGLLGIVGGIAGGIAGDAIQDGHHGARDIGGGALKGAAEGAGTGAMIGSIIPGIGTGIGAAIGGAIGGIKGAADGAGGFGPLWDKIKGGATDLGKWIADWAGKVPGIIGDALKSLGSTIAKPFVDAYGWVTEQLGKIEGALSDAWSAITKTASDAWHGLIDGITGTVSDWWSWLTNLVTVTVPGGLSAAWDGIKKAADVAWGLIRDSVTDPITGAWTILDDLVSRIIPGGFSGAWTAIKSAADTAWGLIKSAITSPIDTAKSTIETLLGATGLQKVFSDAASAIGAIWDGMKSIFAKPVNFMIETVYTNGLKKLIDGIASAVGLDSLKLPDIPKITDDKGNAYRSGGILPGYTPGKDVHRFWSPTGGRLDLSGGEGILRPEATSALGARWVNGINALARSGGVQAVRSALAGGGQAFALGGIWDKAKDLVGGVGSAVKGTAVSAFNDATGAISNTWNSLTDVVSTVKNLPTQIATTLGGNSIVQQVMRSSAGSLLTSAVDWAKDKIGIGGGTGDQYSGQLPAGDKVLRWSGLVTQVLGELGLSQSSDMVAKVLRQIATESGGNPNAIQGNIGDINNKTGDLARGLMQVIGSTFRSYAGPYLSLGQYDPHASLYAGLNYDMHKRGGKNTNLSDLGQGHGYSIGGIVGKARSAVRGASDTVLSWLTPGEGVLTTAAVKALGEDTITSWNSLAASGSLDATSALRASGAAAGTSSRSQAASLDEIRALMKSVQPITQVINPAQGQSESEIAQIVASKIAFMLRR